ncbi:hypothetical protein DWF00_07645 [Bosea caraganae]|uniref:Uncharacterized protein n=1 Tax=Bosea caraganae TaxID=2763117 RepID=A0A370L1I4_9HYPH|nr:hypothetical protein [Bosea caraganae]RDJ21084.1 hypothetical protein DWE98_22440 [Bosea caraganae]RDJ28583.1 hypothetical protein DWF00_07645 [Bosea caraganae]
MSDRKIDTVASPPGDLHYSSLACPACKLASVDDGDPSSFNVCRDCPYRIPPKVRPGGGANGSQSELALIVPVLKILVDEIVTLTQRLESSLGRLEARQIAEADAAKREWQALFSKEAI